MQVLDCERADEMAMGEYESTKALNALVPDNVAPPIAWGTFQLDTSTSFFLTGFRQLLEKLPPTSELLAVAKKMHQSSNSPSGKFGFPVTTFYGPPPMDNAWTDSWEEYFAREFRSSVMYAQRPLHNDQELAELAEEFIETVIPRLLRPLQTGGRSIKPTLCHGDLWDANVQMDAITNQTVLFDPCCFYGHNESWLNHARLRCLMLC